MIEVAFQLNYGSVDEFENQFTEWVGYSPEDFKQLILWDSENESRAVARL